MEAKFLDLNKPWSCKYGRKNRKNSHVWLCCAWMHPGTKRQPILFSHRSTNWHTRHFMASLSRIESRKTVRDPEILQSWLTRHKAGFQLVFTSDGVGVEVRVDCSQSPIFPWDRRDIVRLRYRGGGRRGLQRPRPLSSFETHTRWQPVTQN